MLNSGIPVPDGFVVLSSTFDHFLHQTDLTQEIDSILDSVDHKVIHQVENASEKIRELILSKDIGSDIKNEIIEEFKNLNSSFVAVRSSATAEDGKDHAWAGQLESFLNTTEDDLLEKVKKCWSSLFTPRAIFYRFEKGLAESQISVAVVVQKMVQSEISGIAFSVHPVTEDRNQLIIEAGFGLGEAIVSGSITPDSYVVEKEPTSFAKGYGGEPKIIDINTSTQTKGLFKNEKGETDWIDIPEPKASSQVLNEKQILGLSDLIIKIENHYGFPCDIEWAYEDGKFYIVQSRPITTLSNSRQSVDWMKIWTRDYGLQFFYLPIFGLGFEITKYSPTNFITVPEGNMQSLYISKHDFNQLNNEIEKYYLNDLDRINSFKNDFISCGENLIKTTKLQVENIVEVQDKELVTRYNIFLEEFIKYGNFLWVTFLLNEIMNKVLVKTVSELEISDHQKSELVEYAIKPSQLSGVLLLQKLAKSEDIKTLTKKFAWLTMLDFHNEPATEIDIKNRTIDSDYIEPKEPEVLEILDREIKRIIISSRDTTFMKDARDDFRRMAVFESIPLYNEIARRLGIERQEVSYLSKEEIIEGLVLKVSKINLIDKINYRKNKGFIFGILDSKQVLINDDKMIEEFIENNKLNQKIDNSKIDTIKGVSGSKGNVTGKVRVVNGIKEVNLIQNDEILCVVTTNPDYLPAMQKASAIITDEGGITCHAAIIAREMKKPCIVGTKIATKVLKDGDLVEVDADSGVVRILENK
jgi:phosphohistidine swiveling domain-containing protein